MNDDHTPELPSPGASALNPWTQLRDMTIVVVLVGLLVWLVSPYVPAEERFVSVGQIQGVRYFGSLGVSTQVDVRDSHGHERSLLVAGASQLHKGQDVVMHIRTFRSELCSVDGRVCETLRGNPQ
jgi:hypothetical protein